MRRVVESDVCVIGAGIAGAMVADRLADEGVGRIVVVEAGNETFNYDQRPELWRRSQAYGENPWPNTYIEDQVAVGDTEHSFTRYMAVGGAALDYGGTSRRFGPEDFRLRTLYGVGDDWPIQYEDLEPFYQEAEERIGVAGEQGPPELDPRSKPYPLPPLPLSYNLELLKEWAAKADIPCWTNPQAKTSIPYKGRPVCCRLDACNMCPIGARYSPDFTFRDLLERNAIELHTRTLVRRLALEEGSDRIDHAVAVDRDAPDEPVEFRARVFVLAGGFVWDPHLLLLSANSRFPDGLANRSGLVGKYLTGHRSVTASAEVPFKLYPGISTRVSLLSQKFMRPGPLDRYVRHDFRIWESMGGDEPRVRGDSGELLLGDEILEDWRNRAETGAVRLRCYYDVLGHRESSLSLDATVRNRWGDPMPRLSFRDSEESEALRGYTEEKIRGVWEELVRAGGGRITSLRPNDGKDHAGGGCRMGDDPATSVVDRYGRTHDHENLFVAGAPAKVSTGCSNGALTIQALSLWTAAKIAEEFPARG
jgi:quinoprotein glucose dehydrogenase